MTQFEEDVEDYAAFLAQYGLEDEEAETLYLEDDEDVAQLAGESVDVVDWFRQEISRTYPDVLHIVIELDGEYRHLMGEDTVYEDPDTGEQKHSLGMQIVKHIQENNAELPVPATLVEEDGAYTWTFPRK